MFPNWSRFWCCLPIDVKFLLWFITLERLTYCGGVSQATFNLAFAGLNLQSEAWKQSLLTTYKLSPGVCYLGDGTPVPVYYFDAYLWAEFDFFWLSEESTCPQPCPYTSGMFALPS